ncbi:MAG: hypothetical protein HQ519_08800 [Planctomycetes bacterium]|nr:hypothetical protein [Planctomycetota bacterium]
MNLSFLSNTSRLSRLAMGLGTAVGVSALLLGLNSQVAGGEGTQGDLDRGENPVVGSLPCKVDPTLDLIFWDGRGLDDPGFAPAFYPATLGICSPDIKSDVIDADGLPYGVLNDRWNWGAMGLQKEGYMLVPRFRVSNGRISAWVWTPSAYIGGELCLQSGLANGKTTLHKNAAEIPISALAQMSPAGNAATFFYLKVTPPPSHPNLPEINYQVVVTAYGVRLEHL